MKAHFVHGWKRCHRCNQHGERRLHPDTHMEGGFFVFINVGNRRERLCKLCAAAQFPGPDFVDPSAKKKHDKRVPQ